MAVAASGAETLPAHDAPLLAVRDLFKIYRDASVETVALRGASLDIGRGDAITLLGRSGSGKSTLLSIIAGILLPSAGQVVLEGLDITRLPENARARMRAERIGIVFQRGNLLPFLTAEENVALPALARGRRGARERARRLLDLFGLPRRHAHYPRELSGGEAQRAAIACALMNEPALVLGDEITGELDSATASAVMDALLGEQARVGFALVVVTHNEEVAARGTRRLAMRDGRVDQA